jgi:hypothetical protein
MRTSSFRSQLNIIGNQEQASSLRWHCHLIWRQLRPAIRSDIISIKYMQHRFADLARKSQHHQYLY